jgi:uncharacterized membrane protein YbhN (UPF0104 family)
MRGKKGLLTSLRAAGATAAGVEVPKLMEPRRISWVNLALVAGTLIGGWALIGVLVNVTKSWSTISGADWAWVAAVFVLAQAAYPALAVTTVGSVTDTLPYGRTVALEVSNTFVALAGGSMGALATRVRFFQQQGYNATLAVSSGVLISTASWIVKGGLFLLAIPIALSQFHFGAPSTDTGGGSGKSTANMVWLIIVAVVVVGIVLGLVLAVPRWRRLATAKLRPKASEVWSHLKVLSTHPRNLVEIFGGEIAGQVLVAMALGAALHAFGQHLSLASLLIVLTLGSMLGGISPVPGGMGVVEAGMIIGLTAAGIPESDAVAAVFVQRLFTAYLPPIWGWFCLIWMRWGVRVDRTGRSAPWIRVAPCPAMFAMLPERARNRSTGVSGARHGPHSVRVYGSARCASSAVMARRGPTAWSVSPGWRRARRRVGACRSRPVSFRRCSAPRPEPGPCRTSRTRSPSQWRLPESAPAPRRRPAEAPQLRARRAR